MAGSMQALMTPLHSILFLQAVMNIGTQNRENKTYLGNDLLLDLEPIDWFHFKNKFNLILYLFICTYIYSRHYPMGVGKDYRLPQATICFIPQFIGQTIQLFSFHKNSGPRENIKKFVNKLWTVNHIVRCSYKYYNYEKWSFLPITLFGTTKNFIFKIYFMFSCGPKNLKILIC